MSSCKCEQSKKKIDERRWFVVDYKCNYSAFSGYRKTSSDYSAIYCDCCGASWRTKAAFVEKLRFADNEKYCRGEKQ